MVFPVFLVLAATQSLTFLAAENYRTAMVISDEVQFRHALTVFGNTYKELGRDWVVRNLSNLRAAGISSMSDLGQGCKDGTVNLDLELFGVPAEEKLSDRTLAQLTAFLPGPVGFRCFRLAQKCAEKVKNGTADVKYVHRPESGKIGEEQWDIPVNDDWTMYVDCAGFVRNILKVSWAYIGYDMLIDIVL
jgi:hypothetical protein